MDSNGPDVKIRGTAAHIFEKYQALARDAQSAGDRIGAENYLQHAEHYHRLIIAAQQPMDGQPRLPQQGGGQPQGGQRLDVPGEAEDAGGTDADMMQDGNENQGAAEEISGSPRQRPGNRRRRPRQEPNGSGEVRSNDAPVEGNKTDTVRVADAVREDIAKPEGVSTS